MQTLGIFAKRPAPGKTKTRLAASIGDAAATELYAAFVEDLLTRIGQRTESLIVAVTPDDESTTAWFAERITHNSHLQFQPDGHLGTRIQWFFNTAFAQDATEVVLIGSDSPDLPGTVIDDAFQQLKSADMVLTPATDGGFVLIGLSKPIPNFFGNIPWSSTSTLTATLEAATSRRMNVKLLSPWYDIDTVENLGTLLAMQRASTVAAACPKTRQCLEALWRSQASSEQRQDTVN